MKYKVVLLGDGSVGKTSIRKRYLGDNFSSRYSMTIGADFAVKRSGDDIIQIWDLAGQPRFKSVREVYYKGADGAIVVFDVTRPHTFQNISKWLKELIENNGNKIIPFVLVANKIDVRTPDGIQSEDVKKYAVILTRWAGFQVPWIEVSAKENVNVQETFDLLIRQMLGRRK